MLTSKTWNDADSTAAYYLDSEQVDQVNHAVWFGKTCGFLPDWPERVDSENLMHLLEPAFASPLRSHRKPAIDLAFTAPKPVSVLAALTDAPKREAIIHAHLEAVRKAMTRIETEYAMVKLTAAKAQEIIKATDGRVRAIRLAPSQRKSPPSKDKDPEKEQVYLRTHNLAAALFTHFCARPVDGEPDPNLHTHCLIPRITQRGDGEWGTLFINVDTKAPEVNRPYGDTLLDGLKKLGISARSSTTLGIEIPGISNDLLDAFSRRSRKIGVTCEAYDRSDAGGEPSPAEKRLAALFTREAKGDVPWTERIPGWRRRAISVVAGTQIEAMRGMLSDAHTQELWERLWASWEIPQQARSADPAPKTGIFPQR